MVNFEEIILMTDSHLKKGNEKHVKFMFKQVIDYALDNGINQVFHLADFFTNRIGQSLSVLITFKEILDMFREHDIRLILMGGNHDKTDQNSTNSYIDIFQQQDDVLWFVNQDDYFTFNQDGISHSFIPYYPEETKYMEVLEKCTREIKKSNCDKKYLYTHVAINGVKNNDGGIMTNNLKRRLFDIFDQTFVGHYHNACKVGKKIYYIGSTDARNFGEDNEKGFVVLYPKTGKTKRVQLDFPHYLSFSFKMYYGEFKKEVIRIQAKYKNSKHNIRLIFEGSKSEFDEHSLFRNKLIDMGFKVKFKDSEISKNIEIGKKKIDFKQLNIKQEFIKYCSKNSIKGGDLKLGLNFIKEI